MTDPRNFDNELRGLLGDGGRGPDEAFVDQVVQRVEARMRFRRLLLGGAGSAGAGISLFALWRLAPGIANAMPEIPDVAHGGAFFFIVLCVLMAFVVVDELRAMRTA